MPQLREALSVFPTSCLPDYYINIPISTSSYLIYIIFDCYWVLLIAWVAVDFMLLTQASETLREAGFTPCPEVMGAAADEALAIHPKKGNSQRNIIGI